MSFRAKPAGSEIIKDTPISRTLEEIAKNFQAYRLVLNAASTLSGIRRSLPLLDELFGIPLVPYNGTKHGGLLQGRSATSFFTN